MARFAAITAVAFVLSRLLGLVREQVILAQFGLGPALDAYGLALQIPDLLFILISGGAIGTAFIPVFVQLRNVDEEAAWRMASGVLGCVAVVVTGLVVIAWVFAPYLIGEVLARDAESPVTRKLATELMRLLLLSPLFLSFASIMTAILQSFDRFTLPAFAPVAYNLGIILGALLFAPYIGVYGVAVGVVLGAFIYLVMQLPSVLRLGLRLPRSWPLVDPNVRKTFALLLPRIVGQSALAINTLIAISLASGIGDGRISAFRSAWIVFVLPVGLFGTSIATVAFPSLSRQAGGTDFSQFLHLLRTSIRGVLFFVVPAAAGLIVLREPIISLIYERGEFDHANTLLTAVPLLYFSVGMWAYALVDILPRAFYAMQDSRTPVKIALGSVIVDALLAYLLVGPLELAGLALAFVAATIFQAVLLMYSLHKRVGTVLDRATLSFIFKALITTGLMLIGLWLLSPLLVSYSSLTLSDLLIRLSLVVSGAGAVYIIASIALRQQEAAILLGLARR